MKLFELIERNYFLCFLIAIILSGIFNDINWKNTANAFGIVATFAFIAWLFNR